MYPQARKIHAVLFLHPDRAMTAAEISEMAEVPVTSCRILLWMLMDKMGCVEQCGMDAKTGVGRRAWKWRLKEDRPSERMPIDDLLAMMRIKQCRY